LPRFVCSCAVGSADASGARGAHRYTRPSIPSPGVGAAAEALRWHQHAAVVCSPEDPGWLRALWRGDGDACVAHLNPAQRAALAADALYVLFYGDAAGSPPAAPSSWCPDCEAAKPMLRRALDVAARRETFALFEVPVPRRAWKVEPGPMHPFRQLKPLPVAGLPCLVRVGAGGALEGLVESEITARSLEGILPAGPRASI
jgi:hypothetical protein